MNIGVCVKLQPQLEKVSISKSQNRFFENEPRKLGAEEAAAIEVAVQNKGDGKVIVLAAVQEGAKEQLRECFARGADEVHFFPITAANPQAIATTFATICQEQGIQAILCGAKSLERGIGEFPPRLAVQLGWNHLVLSDTNLQEHCVYSVSEGLIEVPIPNAMKIMKSAKAEMIHHTLIEGGENPYLRQRTTIKE